MTNRRNCQTAITAIEIVQAAAKTFALLFLILITCFLCHQTIQSVAAAKVAHSPRRRAPVLAPGDLYRLMSAVENRRKAVVVPVTTARARFYLPIHQPRTAD